MLKISALSVIATLSVTSVHADDAASILAANKAAMGNWAGKATLILTYSYAGQGLTGTTSSCDDVRNGRFIDSYDIPPDAGASGFDGTRAWEREPSGTITNQAGGDVLPLAANESYRTRHAWWQAGYGGATIMSNGRKKEIGGTYDVLTVTPKGGVQFEAWFDANTHLLARTSEKNGTLPATTSYQNYAIVDGAMIARKQLIDEGTGAANIQTLTLTSAVFSKALPASAYAQPKAELSDFSIAGGAHSTTVPFRLLNNHIYADASINGHAPMPFLFDTGGHEILSPEASRALGVKSAGATTEAGGGADTVQSGEGHVDSIRVGDAIVTSQPVSVFPFSAPGVEGVHEAGLVGYEFFARFITRFDYGNHTITFFDKRFFDPKDAGTPVPMQLYHQLIEVRGSYDGIPGRFAIDTGSRAPLFVTRPFAEKNDLRAKGGSGAEAMIGWGVGGPSRAFVMHGGVLRLGGVTIAHPLTMLSIDKGGAGAADAFPNNVGSGILKRFVVTVDYDHNLLYLKPVTGAIADLDTFDRSGLWLNESPEGFKVAEVTKGGPGEAAGLQKDDIVTAVDGVPAAQIHIYDLRLRLRNDAPGTFVTLAVKGRGDVKLTLRDLI